MDGILNINKPRGETSFRIVALVRRLTSERRVGHAGTLDPEATGVLPICLGKGTRVVSFLVEATKTYRAQIELGVTTDTYDASGKVIERKDPSAVSREELEPALASFCGTTKQTPPMYSAVKHHGKRLYQLARDGIKVKPRSRLVKIHHLELIDWQPSVVTIEVVCGKGTYIRSLAHDLGQALGCGANLKSLVRLRCGSFEIKDAISIPQFEEAIRYGYWQHLIYPIDTELLNWTAIIVSDTTAHTLRNGRPLVLENINRINSTGNFEQQTPPSPTFQNYCRAYTPDGSFLAVLHFNSEKRQWQPEKVFL